MYTEHGTHLRLSLSDSLTTINQYTVTPTHIFQPVQIKSLRHQFSDFKYHKPGINHYSQTVYLEPLALIAQYLRQFLYER